MCTKFDQNTLIGLVYIVLSSYFHIFTLPVFSAAMNIRKILTSIFMPPFEKGGHIAFHLSVGRSVGLYVGIP